LLPPSTVTEVITSRAIDMAHLQAKEGANYVPTHLLTMSRNQSPPGAPSQRQFQPSTVIIKPALTAMVTATVDDHRPVFSARSITSAASRKALGITWEYRSMVIES
jgi:hypothetical protein